jgi:tRNA (guanine-N7-)-methyltransferase
LRDVVILNSITLNFLKILTETFQMSETSSLQNRPIRSFVRRSGRITASQQHAIDTMWSEFVLDTKQPYDLNAIFGRDAPKHLEIGFGMGDALVEMAQAHPENDYLGMEVYLAGVGRVLAQIESLGLKNIRVICDDAVEVLNNNVSPASFDTVYIFFPDPWHKAKHNKRRLIQPEFVNLLSSRMAAQGHLFLATDWEDYAHQMLEVLDKAPLLKNHSGTGNYAPRCEARPLTKFEKRGQRLGHGVWDLHYQREA